jgi:lysophospholipase L1-like esterase
MNRRAVVTILLLAFSGGLRPRLAAAEPGAFPFRAGDRVVFLGDSITQQYQYSTYIELYLTTRWPKGKMAFYNAGIGGDTAWGGAGGGAPKFAANVLAEKPAIVTIDFGMNDGGYGKFDEGRAKRYVENTEKMLAAAKKAGVRVVLMSPNAVEVRGHPGLATYLDTQEQFYAPLKELAAKYEVPFVDQYAVTRKVLEKIAQDDAKVKPFHDGIHTSPAGGLLMAHTILKGLHAPAQISNFQIDAGTGAVSIDNCEIDTPTFKPDHVTFDRLDKALPMPLLKDWRELLPYIDRLKDLNDLPLKVIGLKPGAYELTIDGKSVATYTADELAAGVNIGNAEKGPIYDQGMKVFKTIQDKNGIVFKRFWDVVRFDTRSIPDWLGISQDVANDRRRDELAKRDEQIAAKQAEIYKLAAPVKRHWELKPVVKKE